MSGRLFGLGVGPGDSDLITLKALRILRAVPVIAYPAPEDGDSLVRAIAAPHIPQGRHEIVIRTPMRPGSFPAHDVYDRYAVELAAHLDGGRDVAVLCEGDPLFYGSFRFLYERLAGRYPSDVVPGVSAPMACAAVAGRPLVSRNEVMTVLPAPLPEEDLARRLEGADAVAVIKVGRHLGKVRRVVEAASRERGAWYVERATMADQRVMPLCDVAGDAAPYFSMVLVPAGENGR